MHSTFWMEYPGLWVVSNLLTALSYFAIAYVVRRWAGFVRPEYCWLFSAFIGACGAHHCTMAFMPIMLELHTLHLVQGAVDTVMMAVSLATAVLVVRDAWLTRRTGR